MYLGLFVVASVLLIVSCLVRIYQLLSGESEPETETIVAPLPEIIWLDMSDTFRNYQVGEVPAELDMDLEDADTFIGSFGLSQAG